jgi:hypothetical protein
MKYIFSALLVTCFCFPAAAQDTALSGKVRLALADMANGTCSEERLAPALRAACDSHHQAAKHLRQLGEIESIHDYGVQQAPNGQKPTVFRVVFERGTMTWYAEEGADGKLSMLWSDGQSHPR